MSGLRDAFDEIVADVPLYGDLDRAIDQAEREQRHRSGLVAGLAAAAAVAAVIVGLLAITRDDDRSEQPSGPLPTPTETDSAPEWRGPVRTGVRLPVVADKQLGTSKNPWRGWADPADAAAGRVDIRLVAGWGLQLREDSRLDQWMDSNDPVLEYGLVVDTDADQVADCHLALSSDAPRGDHRVLLKNLRTGAKDERVGGPYGYPFEFGFPTSDGGPRAAGPMPSLYIEFLGGWQQPCAAPEGPIRWYAYATLTESGRVTAWDFAPDEAWLRTRPNLLVQFGGRMSGTAWGDDLPLPWES